MTAMSFWPASSAMERAVLPSYRRRQEDRLKAAVMVGLMGITVFVKEELSLFWWPTHFLELQEIVPGTESSRSLNC